MFRKYENISLRETPLFIVQQLFRVETSDQERFPERFSLNKTVSIPQLDKC